MNIKEITCKTALSPSKLPGLDYSLNPYLGCQHQCLYCYAPNILHMNREKWNSTIEVKRNIPLILLKELKKKRQGIIGISTITDPYQPIEKTYKLTRYCLEVLQKYNFPVCIQTKSDLILRDKDIITTFDKAEVMISIGTLNENHRHKFEPGSSTISQRLSILKAFQDTHVKTSVFFGPIYPSINLEEIPKILDVFIEHKVDEIMIDYLHLKDDLIQILTNFIIKNNYAQFSVTPDQLMNQKSRFKTIREIIQNYLKKTDIKLTDAFPNF